MSPIGRWSAIGAVVLGTITVATWNLGTTSPEPETSLDGAQLFQSKGCASCHTGPDSTATFGFPSLRVAYDWADDRQPGVSAEDYVTESIAAPSAFISPAFLGGGGPTTGMPHLRLTSEEIAALVDYILQREQP